MANFSIKWSAAELDFVTKNQHKMDIAEIAKVMKEKGIGSRSKNAIYNKLRERGRRTTMSVGNVTIGPNPPMPQKYKQLKCGKEYKIGKRKYKYLGEVGCLYMFEDMIGCMETFQKSTRGITYQIEGA